MGYDIYIGNAEIAPIESNSTVYSCVVKEIFLDDAPTLTNKSNVLLVGYWHWEDFCKEVGLEEFFFLPGKGLMVNTWDAVILKKSHLETIQQTLVRWKEKHHEPNTTQYILIWLEFWVRWALENCERPAIYNS